MARILVIEDDQALRELIETFCEEEGYEVDAVSNLEDALERLQTGPFDLILRDSISNTPEQFYTRADPILAAERHPPVVVVSAHELDAARVASLGYAALVLKPFDINTLSELLQRLLHA